MCCCRKLASMPSTGPLVPQTGGRCGPLCHPWTSTPAHPVRCDGPLAHRHPAPPCTTVQLLTFTAVPRSLNLLHSSLLSLRRCCSASSSGLLVVLRDAAARPNMNRAIMQKRIMFDVRPPCAPVLTRGGEARGIPRALIRAFGRQQERRKLSRGCCAAASCSRRGGLLGQLASTLGLPGGHQLNQHLALTQWKLHTPPWRLPGTPQCPRGSTARHLPSCLSAQPGRRESHAYLTTPTYAFAS